MLNDPSEALLAQASGVELPASIRQTVAFATPVKPPFTLPLIEPLKLDGEVLPVSAPLFVHEMANVRNRKGRKTL